MSEVYFTSDTHFWHKNIINLCDRPWETVEEMNDGLIERWNSTVGKKDTVYHLGDFCFAKKEKTIDILKQLNGNIRLVRGNHDYYVHKPEVREYCEWVKDYYELKGPNKTKIVMSHYPFEVWNMSHHGSWHLHGHSHGTLAFKDVKRMDVGVDTNGCWLYNIEQVQDFMEARGQESFDHHNQKTK